MTLLRCHLQTREDVLALLREHPLSRSFRRALDDPNGSVEFLGGFTPAEGFSYWGVDVTSRHDRTWHVRIVADDQRHGYRVERAAGVQWEYWVGGPPALAGDDPAQYTENRDDAIRAVQ